MALPPEHLTPRIEALKRIVDQTSAEEFCAFRLLQPDDHGLIGLFIQEYNYIDFNLRRAVEIFASAGLLQGAAAKKHPRIPSSMVPNAVQAAIEAMDTATENVSETIRILKIIERRREFRNLLGHWAARRIPNEDAIMLVSKNEMDAMQTTGAFLDSGHVQSAALDLADIRGIVINEIIPFEAWLAKKVSEWRRRYIGD
jgi:hypothetical protein